MVMSPFDAAFEGFRIIRERPGSVLVWTAAYLLAFLALIAVLLAGLWTVFEPLAAEARSVDGVREIGGTLGRFGFIALIVALPIALAMVSVLPAAINRAVLRPHERHRFYIRFGRDELRLLGLQGLAIAAWLVAINGYPILVRRLVSLSGSLGSLLAAAAVVVSLLFLAWVFIRLSLAVASIISEGRIDLVGAWLATRGHFWRLVAMWLLVGLFIAIVVLVTSTFSYLVASLTGGFRLFGEIDQTDLTGISRGMALRLLGELLVQLAIQTLLLVISLTLVYASAARAYLTIKAPPAPQAEA